MKVSLFDYGVGNLHSLAKALEAGGAVVRVASEVPEALDADALVLPGVGAFGAAASRLAPGIPALSGALAGGMPCLGICLGMQLLFDSSEEGPGVGLGVIHGRVRKLRTRRVPHMGWNQVETAREDPLFRGLDGMFVYYANSFVCAPEDGSDVLAWTNYAEERFPAAVRRGAVWGVQFHPEKSGERGLELIGNFLGEVGG